MASSSAFRIVPETLTTLKTAFLIMVPFVDFLADGAELSGAGIAFKYVRAAQTNLYAARGHRIIAVEVAGDRYFTTTVPCQY